MGCETRGVIGPTPGESLEANQAKTKKENFLVNLAKGPVGRVAGAVLGLVSSGATLEACAPPSAAQIREVETVGIPTPTEVVVKQATSIPEETATVLPTATREPVPPTPTTKPAPTPTETPLPIPTVEPLSQEEALAKVDEIIDLIKNPDPALLEKYPPKFPSEEQNIIIYGADPKTFKTPPKEAFLPRSLVGVRESLEKDDRVEALKRLQELFPRLTNSMSLIDPGKGGRPPSDGINWYRNEKGKELQKYDPDSLFIRKEALVWGVSAIKEKATIEAIRLGYGIRVPIAAK